MNAGRSRARGCLHMVSGTGSGANDRKRKYEGKTLPKGIMYKFHCASSGCVSSGCVSSGCVSFQVEVRPPRWGGNHKLHLGTYRTLVEAHVARDFCTFLTAVCPEDIKAGDYHFPLSLKIIEKFERSPNTSVHDLFRNVYAKCVNKIPKSTHSAGVVSHGKSKSKGSKDPDFKLLNEKARKRIAEMMGEFKEEYPDEFKTSTAISETFVDAAGRAPSLHHKLVSDPPVAGNYPPTSYKPLQSLPMTSQGIQRAPASAVDLNNGEANINQSLSNGTCPSTSSVQQQRYYNDHHKFQDWEIESTLLPAQQKVHNQAFPNLDEVMNKLLPNANLDPKEIAVIDMPVNTPHRQWSVANLFLGENLFDSDFNGDNLFDGDFDSDFDGDNLFDGDNPFGSHNGFSQQPL